MIDLELHDPAHDDRLRACTECAGTGRLPEVAGTPTCGVCLGDRWLWREGHGPAAQVTVYVDHSGLAHSCGRCAPEVSA